MKKILSIATIFIALLLVSCEDFLDVNTDPNNPTVVTPDLILPVGQVYSAEINTGWIGGRRGSNVLGNLMMFNWGESYGFSWHDEEFKYQVTSTFYDNLFDDAYHHALKQYADLEGRGEEYGVYEGIAKIMKAFHFQILVDLYGDIPYSEALQRGSIPTPKYDDAQAIYDDLMVQLDDAIVLLKTSDELATSVKPNGDDVMFGGDITKWIQFANTLKVRILNRESGVVEASYINAEIAKITAEGSGFISEDVAVQPGYIKDDYKQNPYWDGLGWDSQDNVRLNNDATCATQYVLDYLTSTNDPRISFIYEEEGTGHLGVNQGADNDDEGLGADFVSNIGPGHLKSATQDAVIFTLAEHNLNMAELALNGFVDGDAEEFYNAGVQASFDYLGADGIGDYLSQGANNVTYANSTNKLEAIITQKWIAANGVDAVQSWFDYSRTGYPDNLPVSLLTQRPGEDRPVRLAYPGSEVTANTLNLPKQPDVFTDKIFWAN